MNCILVLCSFFTSSFFFPLTSRGCFEVVNSENDKLGIFFHECRLIIFWHNETCKYVGFLSLLIGSTEMSFCGFSGVKSGPVLPKFSRRIMTKSSLSESCFKYRWIDGVERLERYQPGGYHPLVIEDILLNRYQIVHKLGYGTYSTVWLARDDQKAAYVAVKVNTADAPTDEVDILRVLRKSQYFHWHPGQVMVPFVWDEFELQGPNGYHRCYVTAPARSSVAAARLSSCFKIDIARAIAAQMIFAVAYTHARGFVHGGMFSPKYGS